jgi:hypothetical protein
LILRLPRARGQHHAKRELSQRKHALILPELGLEQRLRRCRAAQINAVGCPEIGARLSKRRFEGLD